MKKRIACIHTSLVFLTKETLIQRLLEKKLSGHAIVHLVDDALLSDMVAEGAITPSIQRRMDLLFQAAEQGGAHAIFSLCSSLGPAVPEAAKSVSISVVRIDEAMAEQAVASGKRIVVMATVPTTLQPTMELIQSKADAAGKSIEIEPFLVEGAFDKLMCGLTEEHDDAVCAAAAENSKRCDAIVFAQASMTRLAEKAAAGVPILTSPESGVDRLASVLADETSG